MPAPSWYMGIESASSSWSDAHAEVNFGRQSQRVASGQCDLELCLCGARKRKSGSRRFPRAMIRRLALCTTAATDRRNSFLTGWSRSVRRFGSPNCGGGSPRPERFVSEDAECAAGCEMALDVKGVLDGGVNGQEALG